MLHLNTSPSFVPVKKQNIKINGMIAMQSTQSEIAFSLSFYLLSSQIISTTMCSVHLVIVFFIIIIDNVMVTHVSINEPILSEQSQRKVIGVALEFFLLTLNKFHTFF